MVTKSERVAQALEALRAYAGDAPGDEELRQRLDDLTSNRTVKLSPGGQLLVWRADRGVWVVGGASTARIVAWVYEGGQSVARELAACLEEQVAGSGGERFPFGARNIQALAKE